MAQFITQRVNYRVALLFFVPIPAKLSASSNLAYGLEQRRAGCYFGLARARHTERDPA
jgi:hypothetical protein